MVLAFFLFLVCNFFGTGNAQEVEPSWWERYFDPYLRHGPRFEGDKFFPVDKQLNITNLTGTIECFGDFNSDRYTDFVLLSESRRIVSIFVWDTSMIDESPVDFDYDGKLDLLIDGHYIFEKNKNVVTWYRGNISYPHFIHKETFKTNSIGQVTVIDFNSDLLLDILGQRYDGNSNIRYVYLNNPLDPGNFSYFKLPSSLQIQIGHSFPTVHSNSFVDLNGDCLADLVLTAMFPNRTVYYSVFLNQDGGYSPYTNLSYMIAPEGSGQLTFTDFDSDGNMDIVFPVCFPISNCSISNEIRIAYNIQKRVCKSIFDTSDCRPIDDLCIADNNFTFSLLTSSPNSALVVFPLPEKERIYQPKGSPYLSRIRFGDYNLDGFPDLIFSTNLSSDSLTRNLTYLQIYQNVPCSESNSISSLISDDLTSPHDNNSNRNNHIYSSDSTCVISAYNNNRRTLQLISNEESSYINSIEGIYSAAFFDFDHDGTNDIMALSYNALSNQYHIHGFYNNLHNDANFFITMGKCTQWCPEGNIPYPKPYVSQYGTTVKLSWTLLDGYSRTFVLSQLSQSTYSSLQTPYILNGIGRPANYIDYFFLGIPIYFKGINHWRMWPGIIPNSQLVVIPYPHNIPDGWTPELYLNPSGVTVWIILAAFITTFISGVTVLIFSYMEKRQDDKELKEDEMANKRLNTI